MTGWWRLYLSLVWALSVVLSVVSCGHLRENSELASFGGLCVKRNDLPPRGLVTLRVARLSTERVTAEAQSVRTFDIEVRVHFESE